MQGYYITVHSPSLNQTHREFDLVGGIITTESEASSQAARAANRFNEQHYNHAVDWQGRYELVEMGIHTMPGYQ
jgi:hypothetical protein